MHWRRDENLNKRTIFVCAGDPEASFTKEEMQQGKHQEFEKKLHEQLISSTQQQLQQTK